MESAHEFAILDVMTNEDALPEEDTIPSCRFGRDRQGMPNFFDRMQEDEPQRVSGTHPLGAPGPDISAERRAQREPNNEAHDEMLRAVARGECVIFADALTRENLRVQHSAWLLPDQGAVFATWLFDGGRWRETQSYLVASGAMAALSELLSRGARG
ncbi:MAG TPA: hypothetical protein VHM70_25230 [Polyangiaceae bacterium]|nr:hypothetical protein [Polyangiaceae bacterium]